MGSFTDALRLASLFLRPGKGDTRTLYELLGTHNRLGDDTHYLNLGYWKDATTYDAACRDLAHLLATTAGMHPGDLLLDVGFGFGDQDIDWWKTYAPKRIVGLNVSVTQAQVARRRLIEHGLEHSVDLLLASATRMPIASGSMDCVLALESAFHFVTREDFFREAHRVLRPAGHLALADIVPGIDPRRDVPTRMRAALLQSLWQVPTANLYDAREYEQRLVDAGFVDVQVRSIRDDVFEPLTHFACRRLRDPEFARRLSGPVRWLWKPILASTGAFEGLDYIIVLARRAS